MGLERGRQGSKEVSVVRFVYPDLLCFLPAVRSAELGDRGLGLSLL